MTTTAEKLAQRIVRLEVEKHNPLDADAIVALISKSIRVTDEGDIVAVDADGNQRIGAGPGHGTMYFQELVAETVKQRPALFRSETAATAPEAKAIPQKGNPFVKDSYDFSLTHQMFLINTAPAIAEKLATEAGVDLRTLGLKR